MKTPWHLWVVGVVTLLWNGMGAMDYVMTQTKNDAYMAQFTPEQLEYFYNFPTWVQASWAIAVWFSVLGSILLLLRNKNAPLVLGISFIAMAATAIHNFILDEVKMHEVTSAFALYFSGAIFVVALLLWLYARAMRRDGILR